MTDPDDAPPAPLECANHAQPAERRSSIPRTIAAYETAGSGAEVTFDDIPAPE